MAIMETMASLVPRLGFRHQPASSRRDALATRGAKDPVQQLLRDPWGLDSLFESRWAPQVDVRDTSDAVEVTAEVPGLDQDDVRLTITPQALTIRGEKKERREDERRGVYISEARYGSFVRTVPLPPGLETDRAEARAKHGVVTVKIPKAQARTGTRRIPIST
jgi:HSP20 family protein